MESSTVANSLDELIFNEFPEVEFGGNFFRDVPVILQFDDTPLIEVVRAETAGFEVQLRIFDIEARKLTVVKSSQMYKGSDLSDIDLKLVHPPNSTVLMRGERELFRIDRKQAAGLKAEAQLSTPDGKFVRCAGGVQMYEALKGPELRIQNLLLKGNSFQNCPVGVHIRSTGNVAIGGYAPR